MDYEYYSNPSDAGFHEGIDSGFATPLSPYDSPETSGLFDSIAHAVSSVAHAVAAPVASVVRAGAGLASQASHLVQGGLKAITNNPLWDIAKTGVSFIPGVGTAVSAGMAGAAAIGRGESLKDIGIAAARGALPGGAITQAAFDVATGLVNGRNVTDSILAAARSQLPGGDLAKAAFDAATAIAKGQALNTVALNAIRSQVPGGAQGQAIFDTAIQNFKAKKGMPAVPTYPNLSLAQNAVARTIHASPAMQSMQARQVASQLKTAVSNVQSAIAAIMNRLQGSPLFNTGDVGYTDSLNTCCDREGIDTSALSYTGGMDNAVYRTSVYGQFPGGDVGEYESDTGFNFPGALGGGLSHFNVRLPMSPEFLQSMYTHARTPLRMAILAHGLMPRLYHQTGELDQGGGWIIRSGDSPFAIAQKLTGNGNRWREILAVNPTLKVVQKGSTTLVQPFNPGQRITIPASWLGTATPVVPSPGAGPIQAPPGVPPIVPLGGGAAPIQIPGIPASSAASTLPMLRQGDGKGNGKAGPVMLWQSILLKLGSQLVGSADGEFGPKTDAATRGYQTRMGLSPDGIVGPLTWGAALRELEGKGVPAPSPAPPPPPPVATPTPIPAIPSSAAMTKNAAIQAALAFFYQHHGQDVQAGIFAQPSTPPFGSPDDLTGTWTNRSSEAMLGFQNWHNHFAPSSTPLPEDGNPDQNSVNELLAQNAKDLASVGVDLSKVPVPGSATPAPGPHPPPLPPAGAGATKAGAGDSGVAIAIGVAILASLASEKGRARAA